MQMVECEVHMTLPSGHVYNYQIKATRGFLQLIFTMFKKHCFIVS